MAKSIRSKRMRKLRAFKRIRYGEKELKRLKLMLEKASEEEKVSLSCNSVEHGSNIESNDMDVDEEINKGSLKPSKYPCWLSHFKIKKLAKRERKCKRKEAKRLKKQEKLESRKSKFKKSKKKKF